MKAGACDMSMACEIFSRCYSGPGRRALTSRKGAKGEKLGRQVLLREFQNHSHYSHDPTTRKKLLLPTALISASDRIIDTLSRALVKWRGPDAIESEPADQIWIAFIAVPESEAGIYHLAQDLAEELGGKDPWKYKHEYVFEWEIPQKYIVHTVSLQTLMDRGLGVENYVEHGRPPSTKRLKERIAMDYLFPSTSGYEIGLTLGFMARCFGARAPVIEIARQFIDDCTHKIYRDSQYAYICYGSRNGPRERVYLKHFRLIEEGIDTALFDLWLNDIDFLSERQQHCNWVCEMEDCTEQDWIWYCIDAYEGMSCDVNFDPVTEYEELEKRQERSRAEIELAATELGL